MSWLSNEVLESLSRDFAEAKRLSIVEDNEDRPYESKYEARKILARIYEQVSEGSSDQCQSLLAHILCQTGCIDVEVEEISNGETNLKKSLEIANQVNNIDLVIVAKIKALNQLGLIWCLREDYEKASEFLENSLESFNAFVQGTISNEKCIYEPEDLLSDEQALKENPPFYHRKTIVLDQLTVYTHYYMGQAYEKLGKKDKASECLHFTLKKQIDLNDYDHLDWSRNASMLSIYYMAQDNYVKARHLLSGANHVFREWQKKMDTLVEQADKTRDIEEKGLKCKADIARTWGKYCHLLLQTSLEKKYSGEEISRISGETKNEDLISMGFEDADVPDIPAGNFEEARNIFIPGQKFYNEAKEYYTFEEHCVDYTEINQDLSRMYRALIAFETDHDRKFQMYRRSAQLLEPIFQDLNPQAYLLLCRQLTFELGEIYSAMADLKLQKFNSRTELQEEHNALTNNINKLIGMTQFSFKTFLGTLRTEDGKFPETFSDETCRPALLSMLNLARMSDKVVVFPMVSKAKLAQVVEALGFYKQFSDYCRTHPEAVQFVEEELPLCDEMVKLLPVKILRMKIELGME